ncbi:MAG: hypothetical protein PF483_05475 [Halothiobacillus sp.]|nr:hypothetical protein [Halothiobacillus sp.]
MRIVGLRLNVGLLAAVIITVVTATPAQASDNYILGRCQIARPDSGTEISPVVDGDIYMVKYRGNDPRYKKMLNSGGGYLERK